MKELYWIILLIIFLSMAIITAIGIFFYFRITNKLKNGLVARIHMPDTTIQTQRHDIIPPDAKIVVKEGNDSFTYFIREKCIEKGTWGKYIDYDYHVSEPINPRDRNPNNILGDIKEMCKGIGAVLDTDLYVKLLRNSKFEDFVRMLLIILVIANVILLGLGGVNIYMSSGSSSNNNNCVLKLDNQTWNTIYIASHIAPQSQVPAK